MRQVKFCAILAVMGAVTTSVAMAGGSSTPNGPTAPVIPIVVQPPTPAGPSQGSGTATGAGVPGGIVGAMIFGYTQ